jgi:aldose 1-epimerase
MKDDNAIEKTIFGNLNGQQVDLYTLLFPDQLEVKIANYGGIITSLKVPDKNGLLEDVVLGYDDLQGYLDESPYFGALVGRYGNRIKKGQFEIDGQTFNLAVNNGENHLHGGLLGFDKVVWEVIKVLDDKDLKGLTLGHVSEDGEEGYPGRLTTLVHYTFTPDSFEISYEATTDKTTVVNLTQHSYFNLSGNVSEDILGHELLINAGSFLPVDNTLIPTGEYRPVVNTPFDFTISKQIGLEIGQTNEQLDFGGGYDHCWVLSKTPTENKRKVATLLHKKSGRKMEVLTTEPGLQFYSGNFLDGKIKGKKGIKYEHRFGLCLETQHFPDSPNQKAFPSVILEPGETYSTSTKYVFSIKR